MRIIEGRWNEMKVPDGGSAAIGNFDGLHRGHRHLLRAVRKEAKVEGWPSGLVTFEPHPAIEDRKDKSFLLTSKREKRSLWQQLGLDYAVILRFDGELKNLTSRQFSKTVINSALNIRTLHVGFNFRYGACAEGDVDSLREEARLLGFSVRVHSPVEVEGETVSSTRIRSLVREGDMEQAKKLLGRPYSLRAPVVPGEGRGGTIGFPTANLSPDENKLLPRHGVYAGCVRIATRGSRDRSSYQQSTFPAVTNVGYRPTFGGQNGGTSVEVHILNFEGNLYGEVLEVRFWRYLRPEIDFQGVEQLRRQIEKDCRATRALMEESDCHEAAARGG